ncbi:MAG: hypothetical protein R3324_10905, partial [Halobacteriales archaeon]|nr:hypothetical protein [Halobacteriales archaeon]
DPRDAGAAQPDIWYVVVDRYGRSDTLRRAYGVDNSWFLDGLTDLGFDVASRSYANYATSATSLASTLNLSYLSPAISSSDVDIRVLRSLLEEHRVGGFLRDQGYEYVHVGNWWQLTRSSTNATRVINASRHSEFGQKFLLTTALPRIREVFGVGGVTDPRRLSRAHSLRQLEALDRLAVVPSPAPRLVFAHLAIPHEPYVFDRDGSWVSQDLAMARGVADSYSRQLEYLNGRLHRLVTSVLAADDDAVVILQADEGPYPERWNHPDMDWTEASDQELRLKFAILTAIHLPSELSWDVPEDLSPVNTFRLLFDQVFGTELGALPQRTYLVPDEQSLFDEVEVTGRLH